MTDLSYIKNATLERLNLSCIRFTNYDNFQHLVSKENNFRLVYDHDPQKDTYINEMILELVNAYDDHMRRTNDPRRSYRYT